MKQKEIAEILGITPRQVRTHTQSGVLIRNEDGSYNVKDNVTRYTEFERIVKNTRGSNSSPTKIFLQKFNQEEHSVKTVQELKEEIFNMKPLRLDYFLEIYQKACREETDYSLPISQALMILININTSISNFSFAADLIQELKLNKEITKKIYKNFIDGLESIIDKKVIFDVLLEAPSNEKYHELVHLDDVAEFEKLLLIEETDNKRKLKNGN